LWRAWSIGLTIDLTIGLIGSIGLNPRGPSSQEKGVQDAKVHLARGNRLGREKILHHLQQPWTVKFHVPMCP
jgi:hypothetical protein